MVHPTAQRSHEMQIFAKSTIQVGTPTLTNRTYRSNNFKSCMACTESVLCCRLILAIQPVTKIDPGVSLVGFSKISSRVNYLFLKQKTEADPLIQNCRYASLLASTKSPCDHSPSRVLLRHYGFENCGG